MIYDKNTNKCRINKKSDVIIAIVAGVTVLIGFGLLMSYPAQAILILIVLAVIRVLVYITFFITSGLDLMFGNHQKTKCIYKK